MSVFSQQQNQTRSDQSVSPARSDHTKFQHAPVSNPLLTQHAVWGNQALQRLLHTGAIQFKLTVNQPGDKYEQEADRVADQVVRMPEPHMNQESTRLTTTPRVQRRVMGGNPSLGKAPPIVHEVLSSPGQPLDRATLSFFEPRFGYDLGHVRVHSGTAAEQSAHEVHAHAYTVGHNIVFDSGRFLPGTSEGRRLIAHELTHVIHQQPIDGMMQSPTTQNKAQAPPQLDRNVALERAAAIEPVKLRTRSTAEIQRSTVDVAFSNDEEISGEQAIEEISPESRLQMDLKDVYFALAEIMTYYETKEAGWVEGVERTAEDALNSLSSLHSALGRKAIETNGAETYQLQQRYIIDYFDLKNIFDNLHRAASPELTAEVIPTTAVGQAIGILKKLAPWWVELGLNPSSPVIEAIAFTLPETPTYEAQYNNYLALFVEGFEKGLGKDIGEASVALAERHLRSSVALAVFQPIYLAGMVTGIYNKGTEIAAEIEEFYQDPQTFITEMKASIKAMISLPADQIALTLGESTGQSIRETINRLKDQDNAYAYIFELGKVMGPLVAGVIIEIIFSKGVGWMAGKALGVLHNSLERLPSIQALRRKHVVHAVMETPDIDSPDVIPGPSSRAGLLNEPITEFNVEGEKHTFSVVEEGGQLVLWMCSNGCGPLWRKIRSAIARVEKDSASQKIFITMLEHLKRGPEAIGPVEEKLKTSEKVLETLRVLEGKVEALKANWNSTTFHIEERDRLMQELETLAQDNPSALSAVIEAAEGAEERIKQFREKYRLLLESNEELMAELRKLNDIDDPEERIRAIEKLEPRAEALIKADPEARPAPARTPDDTQPGSKAPTNTESEDGPEARRREEHLKQTPYGSVTLKNGESYNFGDRGNKHTKFANFTSEELGRAFNLRHPDSSLSPELLLIRNRIRDSRDRLVFGSQLSREARDKYEVLVRNALENGQKRGDTYFVRKAPDIGGHVGVDAGSGALTDAYHIMGYGTPSFPFHIVPGAPGRQ